MVAVIRRLFLVCALLGLSLTAAPQAPCTDCATLAKTAGQLELQALAAEKDASMAESTDRKGKEDVAAKATQLADDAAKAWQAYYACTKAPPCPPPASSAAPANPGVPASPGVPATPGVPTTPGIANCPEAQKWLDLAARQHALAAQLNAISQAIRTPLTGAYFNELGHSTLDLEAQEYEYQAHFSEQMAAFALQKCAETAAQAPPAPTIGSALPGGQPANAAPPPGATKLPHNGDMTAGITIVNSCTTLHRFHVDTSQFPKGLVQANDPFPVLAESSRKFPLTYSSKGIAPGSYSGSLVVSCIDCDASCGQAEGMENKVLPLSLFVPAQ